MMNGGGGAWNEEEGINERHHHGAGVEANGDETRGVFAVSGDEKLLRRLNELDDAETVSTSRKGTDAKWKLDSKEVVGVLSRLAAVGGGVVNGARAGANAR